MKPLFRIAIFLSFAVSLSLADRHRVAAQNWSGPIIARGAYRDHLRSMPIDARPNRPFHFYGNTIRRMNNVGWSAPVPRQTPVPQQNFYPYHGDVQQWQPIGRPVQVWPAW